MKRREEYRYPVVVAREPRWRRLVESVVAVRVCEAAAFALQRVDAARQVDEEPRAVVDGEGPLRRREGVVGVHGPRGAAVGQLPQRAEVHHRVREVVVGHQRAVDAVGASAEQPILAFINYTNNTTKWSSCSRNERNFPTFIFIVYGLRKI